MVETATHRNGSQLKSFMHNSSHLIGYLLEVVIAIVHETLKLYRMFSK